MTDVTPPTQPRAGRPTLRHKLAYAAGQAGNVLTYQLIGTFVVRMYMPPGSGARNLVPVAAYLMAVFLPRAIDTFFDPYIANRSDRSRHALGRRRFFLVVGAVPLALFTAAVFFPPFPTESFGNGVFLFVTLTGYFCCFSIYVGPYLALLPELFPDKDENTQVSTMMAAAALFGGILATVVGPRFLPKGAPDAAGLPQVDGGDLSVMAAVLAAVSLVLLAIPALFVQETRFVGRRPDEAGSHLGPLASLRQTFADKAFVPYVAGSTCFFVGFTVIQTAAPFFVEVLLRRSLNDTILVIGPLFGMAALFFFAVGPLQRRFGKRQLMIVASLLLAALMGLGIPALPLFPALAVPLFGAAGVSIALFLALPNAILADVCEAEARRTGERREGMYFGAQGSLQKVALGAAVVAVPALAETFGKSTESPLGVQLAGPLAALFLIAAAFCFWRYPERAVQAAAAQKIPQR